MWAHPVCDSKNFIACLCYNMLHIPNIVERNNYL
jgi:hypothetical protein